MDFRDRAQFEADRYGADPWIFVRELLQNARDAGARRVIFTTRTENGQVTLTCRDNGDGMSAEHARKFLFRLYASSKENEKGMAGRFGVGFWSILRFEPSHLTIRSWPSRGEPWEISLDGSLQHADTVTPPPSTSGTELVLTRPAMYGVSEQVRAAAFAHARFLQTRNAPIAPLEILVDGVSATAPLELPAPSATFHKRGVRGVVALGAAPQVELFSKGLHVRSAANVDELLSSPDDSERKLDPLLDGLAPVVILDGESLNLVRSRSDARDDKSLRRVVELAQKELARLIERQLAFSRPVPLWRRALRPVGATLAALLAVAVLVGGFSWLLDGYRPTPVVALESGVAARTPAAPKPTPETEVVPYRDPSHRYFGPQTDALPKNPEIPNVHYRPAEQELLFSVVHLIEPDEDTELGAYDVGDDYPQVPCLSDCVTVTLGAAANGGWLRLPVPTGYVLDAASVSPAGFDVRMTAHGEPVIRFGRGEPRLLSYRVGPGSVSAQAEVRMPIRMPAGAPRVSRLSPLQRVRVLREWVAERVKYSNDPAVAMRTREYASAGLSFVQRTLKVGAGDCDVQNALLALVLQSAEVDARLAIGYRGRDGHAQPLLHAWVEFRLEPDEPWRVVDASANVGEAVAGVRVKSSDASPSSQKPAPFATPAAAQPTVAATGFAPGPADAQSGRPMLTVPRSALWLLALGPLFGLAFFALRPRVRRSLTLDEGHDVSRLLRGALARPEAFAHVPALFEQPLVPRRGGGLISLGAAYELAAAERLYASDAGLPFSEKALAAGAVVLDAMKPEGKVVAEALGAVNLDRWDRLLRDTRVTPVLEAANRHLASLGESWQLFVSPSIAGEPAVLNVPGGRGERWVVVNADATWFTNAQLHHETSPARALFDVVDTMTYWLRVPAERRARLLAPLAKAAMAEELAA